MMKLFEVFMNFTQNPLPLHLRLGRVAKRLYHGNNSLKPVAFFLPQPHGLLLLH